MRRLKFLLLAATVVYLLAACGKEEGQAGGPPGGGMPPTMVETAKVEMRSLPNQFESIATLRADESIIVRPEIAGRIQEIHFAEGQQVAAGELLFTLDDALTRADLNEADANVKNSKRTYTRAQELAERQLIAKSDLDSSQAVYSVFEARAASARTKLDKTRIRAPFAGVAGLRNVSVGDYVEVGQELVQLVQLDPIMLDLRAPEVVLSSLAVGQKVDFGVDTFRDERFVATVVAIAPTVDAGGRSVALRARLANPDQKLRPGMSARVRITLTTNARALLIPEQAIWPSGEQKMVYKVSDGAAKLVPVTLGSRHPGLVEITSGLKAGDEVVVAGQLKLFDGAKVVAKPAEAAAAAAAKPAAATPTAH